MSNNKYLSFRKYPSRSPSPKNWKGLGRLEFEEKEEFIDKMN